MKLDIIIPKIMEVYDIDTFCNIIVNVLERTIDYAKVHSKLTTLDRTGTRERDFYET